MVDRSPLKVSVITVCLNAQKHIEAAIQSVIRQSYKNIEYIIVDGGSTDYTLDIIKRYKSMISIILSEPDKGIYDAQNKGIKLATGEIVNILNSDDHFYNDGVISDVVNLFKKKNADFIYGNIICTNLDTHLDYVKKYPRYLKKRFFLRDTISHAGTFFRKDCFLKIGYYDTRYKVSADYEWYLRALFKNNLTWFYANQVFSVFFTGGCSGNVTYSDELKEIQRKYFSRFDLFFYKLINFVFYSDIIRHLIKLIFGKKAYGYIRDWNRKRRSRYLITSGR